MRNVILCGFMGCGKTSVGKQLASILNCKFIDTDELIEKEHKKTIEEIFKDNGEDYFRDLEHEICKKISNIKESVISTGGGLMTYNRNVEEIKKENIVIFLDASFSVICKRIGESDTRPLFKDKEKTKKLYDDRKEKYMLAADYTIDGNMSIKDIILAILNILKMEKES